MAKNWAICIGINHYDYNRPLECAVNDATAMGDFFRNQAKFDNIYLFTDNSPPILDMSNTIFNKYCYSKIGIKLPNSSRQIRLGF